MQGEPDQTHTDGITFRPSTNFKNMKKYLKGVAATTGGETSRAHSEEAEGAGGAEEGAVHPPLPREPPPPDCPPVILKEEVEDDDYHGESEPRNFESEEQAGESDGKKRTMCRKFARGSCPHGASCIFTHEIILSQLHGIYTFCKDFQNRICTYPGCKFVHATVFEKEYFYRTGYLPPHSLAHIKDPQASGSGSNEVGKHPEGANSNINPQPAPINPQPAPPGPVIHPGVSVTLTGGVAESAADAPTTSAAMPPQKREWQDSDELASAAARDPGRAKPKCSQCDINEFRLQQVKARVEEKKLSNEELKKKMRALDEKLSRQKAILSLITQTGQASNKPGPTMYNNARNEQEKSRLEIMRFLMQELRKNEQPPPPPDTS